MKLFAQPLNPDASGFYFESNEDFNEKAPGVRDSFGGPIEEFEIQFIDGDQEDCDLFNACKISQADLELWFDKIEPLDTDTKAALFYAVNNIGYSLADALDKVDDGDVKIAEQTLEDAAAELLDDCYSVPEGLESYIDYEKFAHDCQLGGDMAEFDFAGSTWTCTNASEL